MSASSVANRASAEGSQLAHVFHIRHLLEEVSSLRAKIEEGGVSVGVVMSSLLEGVQREHRQLSQYIGESSVRLEALSQRYQGRASGHIARSQEAIG